MAGAPPPPPTLGAASLGVVTESSSDALRVPLDASCPPRTGTAEGAAAGGGGRVPEAAGGGAGKGAGGLVRDGEARAMGGALLVPPTETMALATFKMALAKRRAAELSSFGLRVAEIDKTDAPGAEDEATTAAERTAGEEAEAEAETARVTREGEAAVARLEEEYAARTKAREEKIARLREEMEGLEMEQLGLVKKLKEMQKVGDGAA